MRFTLKINELRFAKKTMSASNTTDNDNEDQQKQSVKKTGVFAGILQMFTWIWQELHWLVIHAGFFIMFVINGISSTLSSFFSGMGKI